MSANFFKFFFFISHQLDISHIPFLPIPKISVQLPFEKHLNFLNKTNASYHLKGVAMKIIQQLRFEIYDFNINKAARKKLNNFCNRRFCGYRLNGWCWLFIVSNLSLWCHSNDSLVLFGGEKLELIKWGTIFFVVLQNFVKKNFFLRFSSKIKIETNIFLFLYIYEKLSVVFLNLNLISVHWLIILQNLTF